MDQLSQEEVATLLHAAATPQNAAIKLGRSFAADDLTLDELEVAGALLSRLLLDASLQLREIIADTVKNSPGLPHDLALQLARDEDSVAGSILEHSPVLTDQDLIEIIESDSPEKQIAIARRAKISSAVVSSLIQTDNNRAVTTLIGNKSAAINEQHLEIVAARFGNVPSIVGMLTQHPRAASHLAERLRDFTTITLMTYLKRNPTLSGDIVIQLVLKTRESLPQSPRDSESSSDDATIIVRFLAERAQLSPQLILRALCSGDIDLFEAALAKRAGISLVNTKKLIHEGGPYGLKSLYDKAELPAILLPPVQSALDMLKSMSLEGQPFDRHHYHRAILERVLTRFPNLTPDDLDYLLIKLNC